MSPRGFVWLFAFFALGHSLADVRVTLRLPLVKKDQRLFKVTRRSKPDEYTQYTIEVKKREQMIRRVDFGKFTLFNTADVCDAVTSKRSVIVTLTASGILVRVKSETKYGQTSEFFLCDTQTYYKLADAWDYLRFARPKEYFKVTSIRPFPAEMAVFVPVFENDGKEAADYLGTRHYVDIIVKKKRALALAKPPSPRLAIRHISFMRAYTFPFPQVDIYDYMKHYYAELLKINEADKVRSSFRNVKVSQPYKRLDCLTKTFATKYYMNSTMELDKSFNNI